MTLDATTDNLTTHTAAIVAQYVTKNSVPTTDLPGLISTVYQSLAGLGTAATALPAELPQPAVSIRKSVQPAYIICLEDGKKLKMLKRHLQTTYGMTPDQYRTKWKLPNDYPMVAPNYSAQRSSLAKALGLGTTASRGRGAVAAEPAPAAAAAPPAPAARVRNKDKAGQKTTGKNGNGKRNRAAAVEPAPEGGEAAQA